MFRNSTTIHPRTLQRTNPIWSGDEDLSTIKPEQAEETLIQSHNNGESETRQWNFEVKLTEPMEEEEEDGVQSFSVDEIVPTLEDFEFSNSSIANNGVILEQESLPAPPPQTKYQLDTRIQLPGEDFCLNQALPHLNLVMKFGDQNKVKVLKIDLHKFLESEQSLPQPPPESSSVQESSGTRDIVNAFSSPPLSSPPLIPPSSNSTGAGEQDEAQVVKIDLHKHLQSEQSLPQPPTKNASVKETNGIEDDISNISTSPSTSPELTPRPPSPIGSGDQIPIPTDVSPQGNLSPRTLHTTPSNEKEVTPTQFEVNPSVDHPHNAADDKAGWHPCYFCHKPFKLQSSPDIPILLHTADKPYPCDDCTRQRQFNDKSNLTNHPLLLDPGTRPFFPCEKCDRIFAEEQNLILHQKYVHRKLKENQCLECDLEFGTKTQMMLHIDSTHFRIRHHCSEPNCGKSFAYISDLQKHQTKVHPE